MATPFVFALTRMFDYDTTYAKNICVHYFGVNIQQKANGNETATLSCAVSDLGMWDLEVGDYVVKGGQYLVSVGLHASDKNAQVATIEVVESDLPEKGQSMRDRARKYAAVDL